MHRRLPIWLIWAVASAIMIYGGRWVEPGTYADAWPWLAAGALTGIIPLIALLRTRNKLPDYLTFIGASASPFLGLAMLLFIPPLLFQ